LLKNRYRGTGSRSFLIGIIMRLIDAEDNKLVRIVSFKAGKGISSKLRQLGLMPGDLISISKRAPFQGPLLVEGNGRSIAIGRGVAAKIEVEICE
jgi:ferrous iron transport protein A